MDEKTGRLNYENRINIFDRYLDKKEQEQGERSAHWVKIIVCICFYVAIMFIQVFANLPTYVNGILSQFQVIISVYLALSFIRTGFLIGLFLNVANVIGILLVVLLTHNTMAITGIIVALFTIVSISIIAILVRRITRQFVEVVKQKEEMITLNEEITASEEELRKSEERAQAIFNSVNDAIFILDVKTGAILEVNNKMQEMYGYTRQEATRLEFEMISSGVPPYQQENALEWLRKASTQGPQIFEWLAKDKTGREFWVDVNMNIAAIGGHSQAVVSVRDITEKKQVEVAIHSLNFELEKRVATRTIALEAANKELEAFAYSVSHDLRTPLRALNGFCSILLEDYQAILDHTGQTYLVRIQEASTQMGQLINDLLNLSRISRAGYIRQNFDLSEVARKIAIELQMQDPQREVEFEITDNLPVNGDPNLMKIVMENLLNNAYKFTSQREPAIIQVGMMERDGKRVYYVRDNGAGFDMKYSGKLFSPFQRLHGVQEFPGTGIGLATVQRIISRHGGQVWAEGVVERGATLYFTLGDAG